MIAALVFIFLTGLVTLSIGIVFSLMIIEGWGGITEMIITVIFTLIGIAGMAATVYLYGVLFAAELL